MTIDEMIEVLQAAKAGKTIESRERQGDAEWYRIPNPQFDFNRREYRVKPEPRTIWVRETALPNCKSMVSWADIYSRDRVWGDEDCKLVKFVEVCE